MNIWLLVKEDVDMYFEFCFCVLKDYFESFILSYEEEYEKEIVDIWNYFLSS